MSRKSRGALREFLALTLLSFTYASFGIWMRMLSTTFTLFQQMYLWLFFATIIAFSIFRNNIRWNILKKIQTSDTIPLVLRAITFYVLGTTLWGYGVIHTTYGNIAFINAIPMGAILGILFLKERITLLKIIAILITFLGLLLIALKQSSQTISLGVPELTAVLSLLFYSLTYIIRKKQTNKLNHYETTIIVLFIASIFLFMLSVFSGESVPIHSLTFSTLGIVTIAAVANIVMQFLINYSFAYEEILVATNIMNLDTVFGLLIALFLYREFPSGIETLGGIFIVTGAIVMKRIADRRRRP